jgi:hypothetical protein
MYLSMFLFLSELGTCLQKLISTRDVERWEQIYFPQVGMLKFIYKGHFLTIKKTYKSLFYWKSKQWAHALVPWLHIDFIFLEKMKISNYGGISKFLKLIVFV